MVYDKRLRQQMRCDPVESRMLTDVHISWDLSPARFDRYTRARAGCRQRGGLVALGYM